MLDHCLRLVRALNDLSGRRLTAPLAEAAVRADGAPHHVFDADALLGLDPLSQVPLRLALARVERGLSPAGQQEPVWALLLPRPGHPGGLRGPLAFNRAALEAGAVVMAQDGSLAWLGTQVGGGVQWRLERAERPLPPPDPREAARLFATTVARSTAALTDLGLTAGRHPDQAHAPALGPGYPARSQALLERAWTVLGACELAEEAQHEVLHSHGVLTRERHLRELADAALDAISAAASWPSRALELP